MEEDIKDVHCSGRGLLVSTRYLVLSLIPCFQEAIQKQLLDFSEGLKIDESLTPVSLSLLTYL